MVSEIKYYMVYANNAILFSYKNMPSARLFADGWADVRVSSYNRKPFFEIRIIHFFLIKPILCSSLDLKLSRRKKS